MKVKWKLKTYTLTSKYLLYNYISRKVTAWIIFIIHYREIYQTYLMPWNPSVERGFRGFYEVMRYILLHYHLLAIHDIHTLGKSFQWSDTFPDQLSSTNYIIRYIETHHVDVSLSSACCGSRVCEVRYAQRQTSENVFLIYKTARRPQVDKQAMAQR